jgi:hypothetical protein
VAGPAFLEQLEALARDAGVGQHEIVLMDSRAAYRSLLALLAAPLPDIGPINS